MLGEIAEITSGGTPSRTKPKYWGGTIPWVKTTLIQNGVIEESEVDEWITEEGLNKSSAKMIPEGTILMAMYGQGKTRGQVAILNFKATVNQACAAIHLNEGANRDFVFQQLLFRYISIRGLSNTGSQENLSIGLIKEIPLLLPELNTQKSIAHLLSAWDFAILKTTRLIEAKESRLEWYRAQFLTGKKRLPGFNDKWKSQRLSEVLIEHGEPCVGTEEVYSVSVHQGLINQIEHLGRSYAAANTAHYNLVKPGDIVYTKSPTGDFPLGIIKQSKIKKNVIVSPLYGVFSPKSPYLGILLDCYFESPSNTINYLRPVVQKGAKNTISVTNSGFLSNSLSLPTSIEEQKALGNFVELAKMEIGILKQQAAAYRKQKRGLMQKLLTGEWRINIK